METIVHIFLKGTIAQKLWGELGIDMNNYHPNRDNWLLYLHEKNPSLSNKHQSWQNLFPFIIWNLWLNRNNNNTNNKTNSISLKWIMNQTTEYKLLMEWKTNLDRKIAIKFYWLPPVKDVIK